MKAFKISSLLFSMGLLLLSSVVFAQDKDDDITESDEERLVYAGSLAQEARAEIEAQYPNEAKEVRAFIASHVEHANAKAIEAYLADFHPPRYQYPELEREYAERVMALKDLNIEVRAIEIVKLQPRAAILHVRQLASYLNENSEAMLDDAIISYRLQKNHEDDRWVILASDRKRLVSK